MRATRSATADGRRGAAPEHFDTVVVGSGFGGSVSAYRLADGGQRVCVLERGKAYPPGSFPRSPRDMARNFWDPSQGRQGLFNVWSFRGIEAVVSSGLGGGSLIYANVLLRKDERWFVHDEAFGAGYEHWPVSRADLDPHYDRVERMLDAQPFPLSNPGYETTGKTVAMREAATALGHDWQLPNLAVSFAADRRRAGEPLPAGPYPNIHGLTRTTCRLSGECDIGCNNGAKNTLDHTYLSAAAHRGAEIRTRSEVRTIAPRPQGGFCVGYVVHEPDREGLATPTDKLAVRTVTADRVVLAAGALGTPYLLLRNRRALPALGPALGTRFCGNGDLLTFLLRSTGPGGKGSRNLDPSDGPVITSTMRVPDRVEGGPSRGYYIQDAGYPQFVNWLVEASDAPGAVRRLARFGLHRVWAAVTRSPRSDIGTALSDLLGSGELSASSLPLLGMGRDVPDGRMRLRKGYLDIDWTTATSQSYFDALRATMADIAGALGGRLYDNPTYRLKRVVTVHPLGGAPMGRGPGEGVVDAFGESFGHPGLFVADGAAMPGPVGPNPALTIAAFADRMADRILEAPPGRATPGRVRDAAAGTPREPTALEFTEEMKGYATVGEREPARGFATGKRANTSFMFRLTIRVDDVDRFVADPRRAASARGWVDFAELGQRLPVTEGFFNLFVTEGDPSRRRMLYRLYLKDPAQQPLTLSGYKDIHDDPGFDLWKDTSTLYTRILRGHVAAEQEDAAEVVAAGILHIYKRDFAKQLTTFRVEGPTARARASAGAAFGRLFLGELWELYGPKLPRLGGRA